MFQTSWEKDWERLGLLKKKSTCSEHSTGTQVKWQKVIIS